MDLSSPVTPSEVRMVNEWEIMFVHLQKLHVVKAWRFVMTLITSEISRKTVRM